MGWFSNLFGGGSSQPRQPNIEKDSLASVSTAKILYGLAEGEISGLVDGAKSIKLDDTPLLNDNGQPNFNDSKGYLAVKWDFRSGSNNQDYIQGFPDVSNEKPVNVQLRQATPFVKQISDINLSAVVVRVSFGALREQKTNGDITGTTVKYRIDLMTDNGTYQTVIDGGVTAKTSAKYERSHRIDLPKAKSGWLVKITRITPDSTSDLLSNAMSVEAITEIIDVKLAYPNTAMLGIQYDARTFSNIAKLSVRCRGKLLRIPSNYDPVGRTYSGIWDGTFKTAYSNNPAWVFYDLCLNWRYGLGRRLDASMIDKWALYQIARYCDEMVSDGLGGQEPRFAVNVYLQSQQDAFTVLQSLSSIFRGMAYWNGEQVTVAMDAPQTPVYTFSRANVVDGIFNYTGTRARDRHTVARVAWDNPQNDFKTEYDFVRDEYAIAKYGINQLDINMMGCTSQGQAQRAGLWALKSEQLENRQVSFSIGLDGMLERIKPSAIVAVSDEVFAGRANGGRIIAISDDKKTITLDRAVTANVGDTLVINNSDGVAERQTISAINGADITVSIAFDKPEAQHIWAIDSHNLRLMLFKIISIKQNDDLTHTVTAIQHEPQKYAAVDSGAYVVPQKISIVEPNIIAQPADVLITQSQKVEQGQNIVTMTIGWSQVKDAVSYIVEWRKDDGNWIKMPPQTGLSVDVVGVYSGQYIARVSAVSAFDLVSLPKSSMLTQIYGKIGKPPRLAMLKATGILFGMQLDWAFAQGSSDTAFTEIQVATAPDTNVALLGQYAYPTNTATINGLQGNLTQYYRGRIVDKLGNTSDWSDWAKGVTDASADKVLDLLNGQITESQLYKDLGAKIDKIGTNESAISKEIADRQNAINAVNATITSTATATTAQINQEIADRKIAVANVQNGLSTETQQRQEADSSLLSNITSYKTTTDNKIALAQESINTVTTAQSATATKLDGVYAQLNPKMAGDNSKYAGDDSGFAGVWTEMSARIEGDSALSVKIDNVTANFNDNLAYVSTTTKATADGLSSLASQVTVLSAAVGGNISLVMDNYYTKTTTDQVLANKLEALKADFIIPELNQKASTGAVTDVKSQIDNVANQLNIASSKLDGVYAQITPRMAGDEGNMAGDGSIYAGVWTETSARIENDSALGLRIDSLQANIGENSASIITEQKVRADAVSSLASSVSTLQSSVGQNTASIQTTQQSINGLNAQWAVKVDVNGRVSGIGLASSNNVSDFAIRADKFYIAPPEGTGKGDSPFVVLTTPTTINGTTVPTGTYIKNAYIADGSITASKIKVTSLSAISADLGDIQVDNAHIKDGAISTAKIGVAQVDTLQIAGEAVIVPRLQYSETQSFAEIDTEVVINQITMNAQGGAVSISFGFDSLRFAARNTDSNDGLVKLRIKRNGTVLRYKEFGINYGTTGTYTSSSSSGDIKTRSAAGKGNYGQVIFLTFLDVPPAGDQVYTVTLESVKLNSGLSVYDQSPYPVVITSRSLHIMGVKR